VAVPPANRVRETVDVVGPICESGDFLARDRELPPVDEGKLIAILDVGAYGMALSSNYNSRPRAAEVLVDGKSAKLIRRRETAGDLMRSEL
jgi:diaminopimelate decarboxylase